MATNTHTRVPRQHTGADAGAAKGVESGERRAMSNAATFEEGTLRESLWYRYVPRSAAGPLSCRFVSHVGAASARAALAPRGAKKDAAAAAGAVAPAGESAARLAADMARRGGAARSRRSRRSGAGSGGARGAEARG
jgi:hypothetical protein